VAGRVRVHLETGSRIDVGPAPEDARSEGQDFRVCLVGVGDHEVGVDLLRCAVGPGRRNMAGCELDPDDGDVVDEDQVSAPRSRTVPPSRAAQKLLSGASSAASKMVTRCSIRTR